MAALIAYFSRADENYVNGQIKTLAVGNTEVAAKLLQDAAGGRVTHETDTQLRIRRVNGNIQRAGMAGENPSKFCLAQVGQRDVVSHHQRQPPVVVLDVERLAHAGRHLVNEAKRAFVAAEARLAHQRGRKDKAKRLFFSLADGDFTRRALRVLHGQHNAPLCGEKLIIHLVQHRFAVDCAKRIAR